MGEIHPDVNALFDLKEKAFLFELDFQKLIEKGTEHPCFIPLPRYPAVTRDLAMIVEDTIAAGDLLNTLWKANDGLIKDIRLFDLYQGNPVPPGKKSLAFRLIYQRDDRTLTDQEVNEFHQKLVRILVQQYGGVLR